MTHALFCMQAAHPAIEFQAVKRRRCNLPDLTMSLTAGLPMTCAVLAFPAGSNRVVHTSIAVLTRK